MTNLSAVARFQFLGHSRVDSKYQNFHGADALSNQVVAFGTHHPAALVLDLIGHKSVIPRDGGSGGVFLIFHGQVSLDIRIQDASSFRLVRVLFMRIPFGTQKPPSRYSYPLEA